MESGHNAPRGTNLFFPMVLRMGSLKNKNKTLTHGEATTHTRRDRDIIYDGITPYTLLQRIRYGLWRLEGRIYTGLLYVSIEPL